MAATASDALSLVIGYVLGSIPFGLVLGLLFGGIDVRTIGSGNIGATNVLRTGRRGLAAATLLLDIAKGAAAVLAGHALGGEPGALIAGPAAVFGHVFPLWLKFHGGKGVATLLGVSTALWWPAGAAFGIAWLGLARFSRRSSVGGMAGGFAATAAAFAGGRSAMATVLLALALLLMWTHRANLARLAAGTEPRIGEKG
jgi:glycerol-3-phosphate acyltransferase PlsY